MKNMNATQASKNLILLPPKTFTLTVIKDGKIISKVTRECHTVNRNFWNAIMMSQSGVAGVVTNFGAEIGRAHV